jgi:hypothetical protein
MSFTKTRIWGSFLAPTAPEGQARPVGEDAGVESMQGAALLPERAADQPRDVRVPVVEAHPRISPRTGTRIMNLATLFPRRSTDRDASAPLPQHAPHDRARSATRILPIEQLALLPLEPSAEGDADLGLEAAASARPASTQTGGSRNVLRMVCVALAAICVVLWVASALMPPPQAPRAPIASGRQAVAATVPTVSSSRPSSKGEVAPVPVELPRDARKPEPSDGMQRAAVDALVHGDEERARSLYEQLARSRGDQPAYAEAARILRTRSAEPR